MNGHPASPDTQPSEVSPASPWLTAAIVAMVCVLWFVLIPAADAATRVLAAPDTTTAAPVGLNQGVKNIARFCALVSYALFSQTMVFGMLITTRFVQKWVPRTSLYGAHMTMALGTISFAGIHAFAFISQPIWNIGPINLFVPFVGGEKPLEVGYGIIGLELIILLAASVPLTKKIGYRRWHHLHWLAYPAYGLTFLHVVLVNDDTRRTLLVGIGVMAGTMAVLTLAAMRIAPSLKHRPSGRRRAGESREPDAPVGDPEELLVEVNNNKCQVYGFCQQEAPDVFRIGEDGMLHYKSRPDPELAGAIRQAARVCPKQAIRLELPGPRLRIQDRYDSPVIPQYGRVVVVGGGLAGFSAAERMRDRGFAGELIVVGEEPHPPYNRTPLSKEIITHQYKLSDLPIHTVDADVVWRTGTRAVGLDPYRNEVYLPGGEKLKFDGLVIATGVEPRRPPGAPLESDKVWMIRNLEDGIGIDAAMTDECEHVVVVGGGFIGCEVAVSALRRGRQATLINSGPALLTRVLGNRVGQLLTRIHHAAGVNVINNAKVTDWRETRRGRLELTLTSGVRIRADLVVVGIGSVPRVEWLRGSGVDTSDGVLCAATTHVVDEDLRPFQRVAAAGDVARWPNHRFDEVPRRVEHWTNAVEMGQAAADALLAGPEQAAQYTPIPRFWSEQHGIRIKGAGLPALATYTTLLAGTYRSRKFLVGYLRDAPDGGPPQVVGLVAFNHPTAYIEHYHLIGKQWPGRRFTRRVPNQRGELTDLGADTGALQPVR